MMVLSVLDRYTLLSVSPFLLPVMLAEPDTVKVAPSYTYTPPLYVAVLLVMLPPLMLNAAPPRTSTPPLIVALLSLILPPLMLNLPSTYTPPEIPLLLLISPSYRLKMLLE